MRVGEILLERGWADAGSVTRAAAEQHLTGKRLCSLLVARGLLDPDHASRALGEQLGVAAALQKHLEHRDRALPVLLPTALARAHVALPIGRLGRGDLIVCARDPSPSLLSEAQRATGERIVLAVAPASQLELLVDQAYERSATEEFDVDMTTGPIAPLDPAHGFSLVELDDSRVSKDFTVAALQATERTLRLDDALTALKDAKDRDAATDVAMRFVTSRWSSALLLTVKEGTALGHRGHGAGLTPEAVLAVTLPLAAPSIVKDAHTMRQLARDARPGVIQDRLVKLLGSPREPLAAPIVVGPRVACVLVVGDALATPASAPGELARLAAALGDAYSRIVREAKR